MNKPAKKKTPPSRRSERYRVVLHLVLIALAMLLLGVIAHFLMRAGTRHDTRCRVPDFQGLTLDGARSQAERDGLLLHVNDSLYVPTYQGGVVLDQLPEPGTEVKPGRKIYITINSFRQKQVQIPHVADRSLRQAKNMLDAAGLEISRLVYRPDMATNYVLEAYFDGQLVEPQSRIMAEMGSGIELHVGVAPSEGPTMIPSLAGMSLRQAKSRLWESGLNSGDVRFDNGINLLNQDQARIYGQSPAAGQYVQLGTEVALRLTLDEQKTEASRREAEEAMKTATEEARKAEQARADSLVRARLEEALQSRQTADSTLQRPDIDLYDPTDADGFFD